MGNLVWLFLLVCCHFSHSFFYNGCKTNGKVMDCTGKTLRDCPSVKKQINNLILDDNFIKNFSTISCQRWNRLEVLSIRNNKLKEIKLTNFKLLQKLDFSRNDLVNINLQCKSLTSLIANSNNLTSDAFNRLVKDMHSSPSLSNLDVSNNQILKTSIELLTLKTNSLLTLNFHGNKLSEIDFSIFNKQNLSIDFSNNNINQFKADIKNNIFQLNFSSNLLTKINGEQMNNFINLKSIDFSNNPLNCLCNESESFIQWIIEHKSLIVNSEKTFCEIPTDQLIFYVICAQYSTEGPLKPSPTTTSKISTRIKTTSIRPILRKPTTRRLTTRRRTTRRLTTRKRTTRRPTTRRVTTRKPTTRRLTTRRVTTRRVTTRKPTTRRLTTRRVTTRKPTTRKLTTRRLTTRKPTSIEPTFNTTTSMIPSSSSTSTTNRNDVSVTSEPKKKVEAWKIVLSVIIPLAAILGIISCFCWFCWHKNNYQRFDR